MSKIFVEHALQLLGYSFELSPYHSRPQSPSFLGHVLRKRGRLQIKPSGSGDENEALYYRLVVSTAGSVLTIGFSINKRMLAIEKIV